MRQYRSLSAFFLCSISVMLIFPLNVFANSSWHWVTDTRPYYILPFAIIVTLAIETLAIKFIAKVPNIAKVFCFVVIGNIISFLAPYVYASVIGVITDTPWVDLEYMVTQTEFYTVGTIFLILTVIAELPVVYFSLRKEAKSKLALTLTIIGANVVTTGAVALIERLLCHGEW